MVDCAVDAALVLGWQSVRRDQVKGKVKSYPSLVVGREGLVLGGVRREVALLIAYADETVEYEDRPPRPLAFFQLGPGRLR